MTDEERDRFYDSGSFDIEGAKDDIVQGALRTMASRIVGQNTQEGTPSTSYSRASGA
jgi:hypothetical protein